MIYPSGDKLEEVVESRYSLVVLAAKRAKQLREGAPKLIETDSTNPLTVALEEIAAGKVKARMPEESELREMEKRRRAAWEEFAEVPEAVEELAEEKPSVQELLRLEGEQPEEAKAEEELPSVHELLKVEDEKEEPEEQPVDAAAVAELLKIEDEPLAIEEIENTKAAEPVEPAEAEESVEEVEFAKTEQPEE